MKSARTIVVVAALVLALTASSEAGSLEKRHGAGILIGMWTMTADAQVDAFGPSVTTSVGSTGMLGGVGYNYWFSESLALDIEVSILETECEISSGAFLDVTTATSAVTSVLFGVKYYLGKPKSARSARPFVKAAVGSYSGSQSSMHVEWLSYFPGGRVESRDERAFGGQLGGGVDFLLSRKFLLGLNVGYNLMSEFDQPIGGSDNHSGPAISMGLSLLFGRGVE